MKHLLFLILFIITVQFSDAQTFLRGTISDNKGETLIGATIYAKNNPSQGTITDFDGNYSLKLSDSSPQVIVIKYIGYQTQERSISFTNEKIIQLNIVLAPASEEIEEVVVHGKLDRSAESVMKTLQMKSIETIDYISKETISKTGDSDIKDAIKRVTGVSTVNDFVTVRGLNDRFVKTTMNSARIPTLDPFTNNLKLDIFPTSLIDNVIVRKTQSPDIPADWAGAYLDIQTRDFPVKLLISAKSSFGFNNQSTFRKVVSSKKGPTDWLGYDNGFRDIGNHYTQETFPFYNGYPLGKENGMRAYDEFSALGLSEYYNLIGIDHDQLGAYHFLHDLDNNAYYRLSLVELGYLAPGMINNDEAVFNASIDYTLSDSKIEAYNIINSDLADFGSSLPGYFTTEKTAPIQFSQELAIGNQLTLFNKPLGYMFGLKYSSNVISSVWNDAIIYNPFLQEVINDIDRNETIETNNWSALINLSYKPNPFHNIRILIMPNLWGQNRARFEEIYGSDSEINSTYSHKYIQRYEERSQMIYQIGTSHFFPEYRLKVQSDVSFTDGKSSIPDYRNIEIKQIDDSQNWTFGAQSTNDRIYRYYNDNILDARLKAEIPVNKKGNLPRNIKVGASYMVNRANSNQFIYRAELGDDFAEFHDYKEFLSQENFKIREKTLPLFYELQSSVDDATFGERSITSYYAMLDFSVIKQLIISGGLRIEISDLLSDVEAYKDFPENDPRREFPGGTGPIDNSLQILNPSRIEAINNLPSVNLLYKILEKENFSLNGRLNYGKSLVRPSNKEVLNIWRWDIELETYVIGNPGLKITEIDNYDIRFESYFSSGEYLSLSGFYKEFAAPIQLIRAAGFSWINADNSELYGLELEGKKLIMKDLFFSSNLTYVYARSSFTEEILGIYVKREDPMYGQAPYIVNAMLDYTNKKFKTSATFSYNVQGPKLVVVLLNQLPNVYEMPRKSLDFKLAKTFGEHFTCDIKVRNILNAPVVWRYDEYDPKWTKSDENQKFKTIWKDAFGITTSDYPFNWGTIYRNYKTGISYVLSIAYNF
ncbi:MAG: carboxypeptidase-like regulatory domain-containing protein [Bacteroidales bacterium]|nr:carboxypeptidase-like regulatory domain-containing protein [Bacteroidales bacterium]MBN2820055.1 carboxypeptidase-like regulatory domain-containing protein [Bacteroidales bacterium]